MGLVAAVDLLSDLFATRFADNRREPRCDRELSTATVVRANEECSWIWLPGITAIVVALILAENGLSVISSALGFSLVAIGMGTLLVCAVSPNLPLSRVPVPGAAFVATVAYSVYLSHKLPIHWIEQISAAHSVPFALSYPLMLAAILIIGSALFFAVERPFLQVRQRVTGASRGERSHDPN